MKYIIILLLVLGVAQADKVKRKAFACPSIMLLEKAPVDTVDNYMDLNMYAIANNCVILTNRSSIEAVEYNANNSKELYQKIIYKKTGVLLYVPSSSIIVEQAGRKGSWRF